MRRQDAKLVTLFLTAFLCRESPVLPDDLKLKLLSDAEKSRGLTVDHFVENLKRQRTCDFIPSEHVPSSGHRISTADSSSKTASMELPEVGASKTVCEGPAVISNIQMEQSQSVPCDANESGDHVASKGKIRAQSLTEEQIAFLCIASKQMRKDESTVTSVLPSQSLLDIDFDVSTCVHFSNYL
jgi:hypothetical protein